MAFPTKQARKWYDTYAREGKTDEYVAKLEKMLATKQLKPEDFSIEQCYRELVPGGDGALRGATSKGGFSTESIAAIDSSAFYNTIGPVLVQTIRDAFQSEANVLTGMIPTMTARDGGGIITRLSGLGALGDQVVENEPYPRFGFGEDWIVAPPAKKKGGILSITWELLRRDATGIVLAAGSDIGTNAALKREKDLIQTVLGFDTETQHNWKGTKYATFQAGPTPWDNIMAAAGAFDSFNDLGAIDTHFAGVTDPNTGEPVVIGDTVLLGHISNRASIFNILNATSVETTPSGVNTTSANPTPGWSFITSRQISAAIDANAMLATSLIAGDFTRAFRYLEVAPLEVMRNGPNSDNDFNQDIPVEFKVRWEGTAMVWEPRAVVQRLVA